MSNPTFATGDLSRRAGKPVNQFRLVKQVDGKVEHNDADAFPFGAVTEAAAPAPAPDSNDLAFGLPEIVRVHTAQCVVKLTTDDTTLEVGDKVHAAADGKVSATGTVAVGIVDKAAAGGLVRVQLFHPSVLV